MSTIQEVLPKLLLLIVKDGFVILVIVIKLVDYYRINYLCGIQCMV